MDCCQCQGIETLFNEKEARNKLKAYRKDGPAKTTRMLIEALEGLAHDIEGMTLLDIGGGVGVIQHELLRVPPVREARERGILHSVRPFSRFTEAGVVWEDGWEEHVDAVIWCTGFKPALDHLVPLGVIEPDGRVPVEDTRSLKEPRLWLLGYGDWTGYASATLVGVGRTARTTVDQITAALQRT